MERRGAVNSSINLMFVIEKNCSIEIGGYDNPLEYDVYP